MSDVLFLLGSRPVTAGEALLALAGAALVVLVLVAVGLWRTGRRRVADADEQEARAELLEVRLTELVRAQSEASGRMQTLAEVLGSRQAELQQAVTERLDSVSHRLGEGMLHSARATNESLSQLHERLAVVDDVVHGLQRAPRRGMREILYCIVSPLMLLHYVRDPQLRRRVLAAARRRTVHPLLYERLNLRRLGYVLLQQANHVRKFARYYPRPTSSGF